MDPSAGHLNGILARVGGNLSNNFQKSQMLGGLPGVGMLKLRFDRYISRVYNLMQAFTINFICLMKFVSIPQVYKGND